MMQPLAQSSGSQRGFTLLEVLISIVVLSFGLLAIAALQLKTMEFSRNANQRANASALASSLADQMLLNRAAITAENFDSQQNPPASVISCYSSGGCTAAQMASNSLYEWRKAISQALPGGGGGVCRNSVAQSLPTASVTQQQAETFDCDRATGAPYVIYIWWPDNTNNAQLATTRTYQRFYLQVQP